MNSCSSKIRCTVVGRGAVGAVYCDALARHSAVELSVAASSNRVSRYSSECFSFNGKRVEPLRYFTPRMGDVPSDFIFITTKWGGFGDALELIRPIVSDGTIIVPLLNGLLPYELAAERYGAERVVRGYYVGCTATRTGSDVLQQGFYETVIEDNKALEELFSICGISYRVAEDMDRARWLKFIINLGYNHTTALRGGVSYGELKDSKELLELCSGLMSEAVAVAKAEGISSTSTLKEEAMSLLPQLLDTDYGSMAQDVIAGRATERAILGDDLMHRAKRRGIETPLFNTIL